MSGISRRWVVARVSAAVAVALVMSSCSGGSHASPTTAPTTTSAAATSPVFAAPFTAKDVVAQALKSFPQWKAGPVEHGTGYRSIYVSADPARPALPDVSVGFEPSSTAVISVICADGIPADARPTPTLLFCVHLSVVAQQADAVGWLSKQVALAAKNSGYPTATRVEGAAKIVLDRDPPYNSSDKPGLTVSVTPADGTAKKP